MESMDLPTGNTDLYSILISVINPPHLLTFMTHRGAHIAWLELFVQYNASTVGRLSNYHVEMIKLIVILFYFVNLQFFLPFHKIKSKNKNRDDLISRYSQPWSQQELSSFNTNQEAARRLLTSHPSPAVDVVWVPLARGTAQLKRQSTCIHLALPRGEPFQDWSLAFSRVPIFCYLAHGFPIKDNFPKPFFFFFFFIIILDEFRFVRRRVLSEDRLVLKSSSVECDFGSPVFQVISLLCLSR